MLNKLIKIITFVDLPIRKKFMLFSVGVLFWFIVMYVISIAANIDVDRKTDSIVKQIVPVDRTIQKITRKLQGLSIDAGEIAAVSEYNALDMKINLSQVRLIDIKSFLTALQLGGQVNDINRDDSELIESISVVPNHGVLKVHTYLISLKPIIDKIDLKLSEMADMKKNNLNKKQNKDQLTELLREYKLLLSSSISLSNELSSSIADLYLVNSGKIEYATTFTFYTFTGVLFIATILLFIFTNSITHAIEIPVKSIISQIRSLGAGKVDLSNKIKIKSKDEIGVLSEDFNKLTEEIHEIVTFKKVIEEDYNIEDVYARLGKAFKEKCGLDQFIIFEVSGKHNKMKPVYPIILNESEIFCDEEILTNCEQCKVNKTGHTIDSAAYTEICRQFKPDTGKKHLCIPMIIGGKTGGVVQFLFNEDDFCVGNGDKRLFRAEQYIIESLSVIEAKRLTNTLRESALKDPLTGLYNRRFLQEYTEKLVAGVLRRGKQVGLIMCDLDYFKQVNDEHGHNVGDAVLKETAAIITKCLRSADLVIRFGGEEFLVLLLDVAEGEAVKVAEKIRTALADAKIKIPDGTIHKTISLGISEFPRDTEGFWQAIKYADVALYKAKETGRNKSVRFEEEMWSAAEF